MADRERSGCKWHNSLEGSDDLRPIALSGEAGEIGKLTERKDLWLDSAWKIRSRTSMAKVSSIPFSCMLNSRS